MNKRDLVDAVAASTGVARKEAVVVVDAVFEIVAGTLASGDKVVISGFGTFERYPVAAHDARNPKTGEGVAVPAHHRLRFKPARAFKRAVS